jgi:hypothetical protein
MSKSTKASVTKATKPAGLTLDQLVVQATRLLDQVAAMVKVSGSALTKTQRQKAVKMRTGGEKFVPVIASLAERFKVNVGGHDSATMTGKVQQAQSLAPLLKRAQLLTTQLNDASLAANSQAWDSATVLYSTLNRVSRSNADVQTTLAPVKEFFAARSAAVVAKRKAKKTDAAKSSAPEASSAGTATNEVTQSASAPSVAAATPTPHA